MADIKVAVTPELVERAVQRDSRHCMIAEAIKAQNPHFTNILVDLATIRWTNPRTAKRYVCLTPEAAGKALVDFDQGHQIEPFSFGLKVMQTTPTKGSGKPRGPKQLDGQMTIHGGQPLPGGHLRASDGSGSRTAARKRDERERDRENAPAEVHGDESNVKRSTPRYRQYGRRILQG